MCVCFVHPPSTHARSRFLNVSWHAWQIKCERKLDRVQALRMDACVHLCCECVTTFKMNIMRVVVQDNSFISFYFYFFRSHFTALKSLLTYFPWWLLWLLFSSFSLYLSTQGGFINPSQFQSQRVYIDMSWVYVACSEQCAMCMCTVCTLSSTISILFQRFCLLVV